MIKRILTGNKFKKGFTLVELMIVIAIISILTAISLFGIQGSRESARDTKRKSDLETIRSALEMYKSDHNEYPPSDNCTWNLQWPTCDSLGNNWIPELVNDGYIAKLPIEVMLNDSYVGDSPHTFSYNYQRVTPTTYRLLCQLENANDSSINGGDYGYWDQYVYVVTNP